MHQDLNCPLALNKFISESLLQCYKKATYKQKINRSKRNKEPWVFGKVQRECEKRDALFLEWVRDTNDMVKRLNYNKQRNKTNKIVERYRNEYYKNKILNNVGNMRKLWGILNQMSGKIINSINNELRKAFSSVGTDKQIADMFACSFKKSVADIVPNCNSQLLNTTIYRRPLDRSMLFKKATAENVCKIIRGTGNNKAPGIDGIRSCDLKVIADKIASAIAHLINESFRLGVFPDELKSGLVRPIYKAGNRKDPSMYRPITMLPILDKVVERYVSGEIHKFYRDNDVLSHNQFGFQSGKSTSMLLSRFADVINQHLNDKKHVLLILIDYSKAFDTLRHKTLIEKLDDCGKEVECFNGVIAIWKTGFFKYRSGTH
jgi:hypothetical protein